LTVSDRFPDATLALSLLPPPAVIQPVDYAAIKSARVADLAARLAAAGVAFDVAALETDPAVILQEEGAYREMLNLAAINDAAKAVMILYAQGADQDVLYALLGVRRLTLTAADPTTTPPTAAVMEGDNAFLARAQIALEGTAPGLTGGGYASVALRASSEVRRVGLITAPGGVVNVILQGNVNADGSVSSAAVQAVAAALNDDWSADPATGSQLTDIPQVRSATPRPYAIVARAIVPIGPSLSAVQAASLANLAAATTSLQLIGNAVPTDALIAAGRVAPMTKFILDQPAADVVCAGDETPYCTSISVTVTNA
jgi:phage-related baseplate assembly protein